MRNLWGAFMELCLFFLQIVDLDKGEIYRAIWTRISISWTLDINERYKEKAISAKQAEIAGPSIFSKQQLALAKLGQPKLRYGCDK